MTRRKHQCGKKSKKSRKMKNWLINIRRAGVPLVLLDTFDAAQSILSVAQTVINREDKKGIPEGDKVSFLEYDVVRGLNGDRVSPKQTLLSIKGQMLAREISPNGAVDSGNPFEALTLLAKFSPQNSVIFIHSSHDILAQGPLCQAVWNLRDSFKANRSTLVLMTPGCKVPELLKYDLVKIVEPLPSAEEIGKIFDSICSQVGLTESLERKQAAIERTRGILTGFAVEQALALSISKSGLDLQELSAQRRAFISQTDGLEIRTDTSTFADVAGYDAIKKRISQEINCKNPPDVILWLDEVREMLAAANGLDGTTRDQLGHWQCWLQDKLNSNQFTGIILAGFPGTCKSLISASTRNEAKCECLRVDFGAQKSKFVGESEQKARQVTRTVDAIGSRILCLATCNGLEGIPAPFLSRFTGGTYFFDLATEQERDAIWLLKRAKFGILDTDLEPESTGWTGRDIHECCRNASRLGLTLLQAARGLTPFCRTNRADIETMRKEATVKGWLSASTGEIYVQPSVATGRKLG